MNRKSPILFPKYEGMLQQVGEQIKLARLRRKLCAEMVLERVGIGTSTLVRIEKGDPGTVMGNYFQFLCQ